MNYETMQKVQRLFDALPNFKNYGYFNEPVVNVKQTNGIIHEVEFPAGKLQRITAKVNGIGFDGKEVTWILGYGGNITGIFVANADRCEGKLPHES
jgi:hypothetical protein